MVRCHEGRQVDNDSRNRVNGMRKIGSSMFQLFGILDIFNFFDNDQVMLVILMSNLEITNSGSRSLYANHCCISKFIWYLYVLLDRNF